MQPNHNRLQNGLEDCRGCIFWGKVVHPENESLTDLNRREVLSLLPLILMVFWIGLYPKFFLDKMNPSVDAFISDFTVRYYEGRRTGEPRLVDFDELKQRIEDAGGLAMAEVGREEVQR